MNEKVQSFLKAMEKEENIKKAKTLIRLGLYEKKYSPDNRLSSDFPFSEWDKQDKITKYYRKVPIEVTDEEYQEVKKYSELKNKGNAKNPIATVLRVVGLIVYITGFFASLPLSVDSYGDVSAMAIVWWVVFFVAGTFYFGFAEIIQLLNDIKNK